MQSWISILSFASGAFLAGLLPLRAESAFTLPPPISGHPTTEEGILPADVLARVELLRAELELIRLEMGRPENRQPDIPVFNAAPREVFFQALTMFRKSNRLSFELTRTSGKEPNRVVAGKIRPWHVYQNVNAALARLMQVKLKLAIPEQSQEKPQPDSIKPTDVFRACVQANRQLNLVLSRRFDPSDVFQEVTVAVHYTARILSLVPGDERIPDAPRFERNKQPDHVYKRLIDCFGMVSSIAEKSGIEMLELKIDTQEIQGMTPSDVYDIASLIVSEVSFLHSKLKDVKEPEKAFYPGRKFPSHVFQRAGILQEQLSAIAEYVRSNPDWLNGK